MIIVLDATSCETYTRGETEEYTVNILPAREEFEIIDHSPILVYPNPAANTLNLKLSDDFGNGIATIMDMNGNELLNVELNAFHYTLDIKQFGTGDVSPHCKRRI